jgi:hypothetical protein
MSNFYFFICGTTLRHQIRADISHIDDRAFHQEINLSGQASKNRKKYRIGISMCENLSQRTAAGKV